MGCAASAEGSEAPAGRPSAKMQKSGSVEETIKVVLLGPGESGKSTVLKQMKILEAREQKAQCWTPEELVASKVIVYSNAAGQMRLLAQLAIKFEVLFSSPEIAAEAKRFAEMPVDAFNPSDPATGEVLKRLWAEDGLRVMYNERDHLFNLNDGAGYFWDALDRIYAPDYVPTEADLLRVRLRTAMAEEVVFHYKGSPILVVDLGGQRQERRKWAEYIHDANTLLFVSSLCEWDQKLREETSTNRMDDTFAVFEQVIHEVTQAEKTPNMVLLLNKMDLFTEKIRGAKTKETFRAYFADYKGPLNPQQCAEHVRGRFLALCKKCRTRVHAHLISALETDNVRLLWHGIRETLVEDALRGMI